MTFADKVGTLSLETPQIDDIGTASIQLVDGETGTVLTTAPLYRCSNRLLATVSFPNATVHYVVVGNDINGRPFTTPLYQSARFAPENIRGHLVQDLNKTLNGTLDETINGTLDHDESINGTLDRNETIDSTLDRNETINGTLDRNMTINSILDRDENTRFNIPVAVAETFLVVMEGDTFIEVEQDQTILIVVRVYNIRASNDSNYTFTAEPVTGFRQAFRPISLLQVPPGESESVNMIILRETAEPGSNYTFTATVSDGYSSHSLSKTVLILLPVSKKLGYYLK